MNRMILIVAVSALALASMACGITINIPVDRIDTGATQTDEIQVQKPDAEVADLILNFGAGKLDLEPADSETNDLINGTATYNVPDFKPEIVVDDEKVSITSGDLELSGIPRISNEVINLWELRLGNQPMNLRINSGAYQGDVELGGLSIESLEVTDGAAEVQLRFSSPNQSEMDHLLYQTGASSVELLDLANANFNSMTFRSGAGDYKLDFSGELKRDADVNIESGFSQVVLIVPAGTSAKVITDGGMLNVEASGDWDRQGDTYVLEGEGPMLTIKIEMGLGELQLRTRG
jgi:hypothetical protein